MNKLLVAGLLGLMLTACGKKEEAAPAAPATEAAAPAADAAPAAPATEATAPAADAAPSDAKGTN